MEVYADLHVHTTHSDGTLELNEVPAAAHDAGVSVVAITDHDRIHPELQDPVTEVDGITLIRSIELRVEVPKLGERIDLLGYGVEDTPELLAEIDRLQQDRETRAQRIIDGVETELEIELPIAGTAGMGRPHIANAIADHQGTEYTYQQAFDELIGHGYPAYVPREVTAFEDGVRLLSESCAFVGLAHPFRYENTEGAIELTKTLDAIEGPYPYGGWSDVDPMAKDSPVLRAADQYDLLITGGTDAHGTTLGEAGLGESSFEPIKRILGL